MAFCGERNARDMNRSRETHQRSVGPEGGVKSGAPAQTLNTYQMSEFGNTIVPLLKSSFRETGLKIPYAYVCACTSRVDSLIPKA